MPLLAPARLSTLDRDPLHLVHERPPHSLDDGDHNHHHLDAQSIDPPQHDHHHPYTTARRSLTLGHWTWGIGGDKGPAAPRPFSLRFPERLARNKSRLLPRLKTVEYATLDGPAVSPQAATPTGDKMSLTVAPGVEIETAPGSPPELSYSKSSKSSDSSSLSDLDCNDKESGFDDVVIEESGGSRRASDDDSNLRPEDRPTLKRPSPQLRSVTTSAAVPLRPPPPDARRPRYPGLHAVNGAYRDQSLNLPRGSSLQRGFSSPASPSLRTPLSPLPMSSRSPSPSKQPFMSHFYGQPSRSNTGLNTSPSFEQRSPHSLDISSRRPSWQRTRKTVQELEAEYDDNDEDVPEGAVLENVPISPIPGQPKSVSPSPHRTPSYGNLHSANVPRKHKRPSAPAALPNGQLGARSPRNGRPYALAHSLSTPSFHRDPFGAKPRSKSWTEDLNDEAKALSEALSDYAERNPTAKRSSAPSRAPASPPRPTVVARSKTGLVELPPLQKGHMMIDPLPISKEKEAVLTRTRPSWLPPKDQKEERKHLRQWEQMMAKAAEAEKRRKSREQEQLEEHKEQRDINERIWDQHVLPNWDAVIHQPKTRELWWRGITPRSREYVWKRAIANDLALSAHSFQQALNRARALEEKIADMPSPEREHSPEAAWLAAIARDVPATFPSMNVFRDGAPLHNALSDVLKAFAAYRADVGYVYGTHLVAGALVLNLRPADAFITLANLFNRPVPRAFLVNERDTMDRTYALVLATLKYKFGKLHAHLTSPALGLDPHEYLEPMFRCLFAYHLPLDRVARIWDIAVFEGDQAFVRAAVAVLGRLESKLYGNRDEVLDVLGWRNQDGWDVGAEEDFIRAVRAAGKVDHPPRSSSSTSSPPSSSSSPSSSSFPVGI